MDTNVIRMPSLEGKSTAEQIRLLDDVCFQLSQFLMRLQQKINDVKNS